MKKLEILTQRLLIRNLKSEDVNDFYFYRSNPDVTRFQGFDTMSIVQAQEFIGSHSEKMFGVPGEWVQYGIENRESKKIIGDCAIKINIDDNRMAEIGITISHNEQRKGYAKETLNGLLNFLFSINDFHRVVEIVDTENNASIALLKSLGFRLEGHFIENIFFKGKWGSEYQYAMLRREWKLINETNK